MGIICDYLTETYFQTTNPKRSIKSLFSLQVLFSILLHTALYLLVILVVSRVFNKTISGNIYKNLTIFFLTIMTMGYIGRLMRSQTIYKYYKTKQHMSDEDAVKSTRSVMNGGYFTYYFMA